MKTKREVLEEFAKNGDCENINCIKECPYYYSDKCIDLALRRIGEMAILRMFRKKEKPLLSAGTKIKFSDGKIATILKIIVVHRPDMNSCSLLFEDGHHTGIDYLIDRTWEIVE